MPGDWNDRCLMMMDWHNRMAGYLLWLWSKVSINDAELVFRDTDGGIVTGVDDCVSIFYRFSNK